MVGTLWGVASRACPILLAAFLCNCHLAFYSSRNQDPVLVFSSLHLFITEKVTTGVRLKFTAECYTHRPVRLVMD